MIKNNFLLSILFLMVAAFGPKTTGAQDEIQSLQREIAGQKQRLAEQTYQLDALEQRLNALTDDEETTAPSSNQSEMPNTESDTHASQIQPGREPSELTQDLTNAEFPKSVPLFGSDWRFSFGGYAKLDVITDFSGTGDPYQFITATIPVKGQSSPQSGSYTKMHVRESRFNFETRNTQKGLPFNRFFLEMDFYDETNTAPRLRHAYFQWGRLIAGQTWTTLTEMRALPFLVDFAYGDALYGGRTVLLRWEQPVSERFSWAAGLEEWDSTHIQNSHSLNGTARSILPLAALRGTYNWGQGLVTVGSSLTQLRWDGTQGVSNATATQWALVMGSRFYLDSQRRHYLGLGGAYGDGAARNIISLAEADVPSAILRADGSLETLRAWNAMVALHWIWSQALSSNFSYAWSEINPSGQLPATTMKAGGSAHVNLIWEVKAPFKVGLEYMVGRRENVDNAHGTAQRVQFMTMFSF
jgi:hypothetical protein